MDYVVYFLVFLAVCIIWFLIMRIWVSGVDLIVSTVKKLLGLNKNDSIENWHTIEDIRRNNNKD